MNYFDAIILGIIEGLTEFIPVSSTGHLIIVNRILDLHEESAVTFDIVIQLGAILAVVCFYWSRFMALLDFKKGSNATGFKGLHGILLLAVAAAPALAFGAVLNHKIKEHLFNPTSVALALIVGGIGLIIFDKEKPDAEHSVDGVTFKQALGVGLVQILSLWPGFSRSGSTIIGGLVTGMSRAVATEFSFLLAVPVLTAACCYELLKEWHNLSADALSLVLIGFVVSFFVAILAIKFFLRIVKNFSLKPFAYYRIILGIIVLIFLR